MAQNYEKQIEEVKRKIMSLDIPENNKIQLIELINEMQINSKIRTVRCYSSILLEWARIAPKIPFKEYEYKRDIIPSINNIIKGKAESTSNIYKFLIKKLFQFVYDMNPAEKQYPACVCKIRIKRTNHNGDRLFGKILEPEEVKKIIDCADNLRDRAMFATLYDGALRVSELLSMKIGKIIFDKPVKGTAKIVVDGKTGIREVSPLTTCVPNLKRWIDSHPAKDNPEAYVWCNTRGKRLGKPISACTVDSILHKLANRAGIEKKVWTHLFRHSKGTFMAKQNINEDARMRFMGHKSTVMQRIYTHMGSSDTEDIILEQSGIKKRKKPFHNPLAPKVCPNCGIENPATARFCVCGQVLDLHTAMEMDKEVMAIGYMIKELIQDDPVLQKLIKQRMVEKFSN